MNKFTKGLIKFILFILIATVLGYIGGGLFSDIPLIPINIEIFTKPLTWVIVGILVLLVVVYILNKSVSDKPNSENRMGKTKDGNKKEAYFSSRLVTLKELKTNKEFHFSYFHDLGKIKFDGIPLRAQRINGKTEINMQKPIHTIVIGTTGSGKTSMFMDPTIQILSKCASKPSMVISDPKGELFNHESEHLKKMGYEVFKIDLRNPIESSRINPISPAYDNFQRAHNLISEVKVFQGPINQKYTKVAGATYKEKWYLFENTAYPDKETLTLDLTNKKQTLINEAYADIQDIANALCPTGSDPQWAEGARNFVRAILMAMLEDSLIPELGMTKEKFTLFNASKIAGIRDMGQNDLQTLKDYFSGRSEMSEAVKLANTVIASAAVTAKGYLSHVSQGLNVFDQSIGALTSETELDFLHFADRPTALFIIIPDETNTRNGIANIFITQLYKALITKANLSDQLSLPRNVYFILDEFGNLPKIEKLKNYITAGRSRRIFLILAIQDYTQLNSIYGEQDASTIRNNCNIHIFIGTKDAKTREEFSKNIGEVALEMTQKNKSVNKGKEGESGGSSVSTNSSIVNVPLISANELDHLKPFEEVVINSYGHYSMRTVFTQTYKNPDYTFTPPPKVHYIAKTFDEVKNYYDIKQRNKLILKNDPDGDDDDMFDFSKFKKR